MLDKNKLINALEAEMEDALQDNVDTYVVLGNIKDLIVSGKFDVKLWED